VEAAYLRSWDVYADAVYNLELDEEALAEVFADEHLELVRSEILGRIDDKRAAHARIDHNYKVTVLDQDTAIVADRLTNHQVLVDPDTKEPLEDDPNEDRADLATLRHIDGLW